MKKFIVLLADGMADWPRAEFQDKTILEVAKKPNMDFIAQNGITGLVSTIPAGLTPGSDIANMALLGYDPIKYYTGRGPIEAASFNLKIPQDQIVFRCNLVTILDDQMIDFTAGHITTEESAEIIQELNTFWQQKEISFFTGVSYRNLASVDKKYLKLKCTPPHDITDKNVQPYLPNGNNAEGLRAIMEKSKQVLASSKVNQNRQKRGLKPATNIWLWGQGDTPNFPLFKDKYGLTGGIVTAVGLLKGIGKLIGFETPDVPGATGFLDTNYQGKLDAAFKILEKQDFVYLHIEAPDETGHMGDVKLKLKAIEDFDQKIVQPVLAYQKQNPELSIMVLPDHATPCEIKTHSGEPVPFSIYYPQIKSNNAPQYSEKAAKNTELFFENGQDLLKYFLGE